MKESQFFHFLILFSFGICLVAIVNIVSSYYYKKKQVRLLGLIGNNYVFKKEKIKCEVYKSGAKKAGYRFNRCDLYILDGAIVITGYIIF
ncbi:hypothetical protein HYN59_14415 [Flavobacterium album]|uniref:Uncharacterized protein n=1 Tax=Flavobacterium album TaxID=2175091 RepID=A0A2S1R0X4_9FLAO|nr:hypothetical protein HYN59_14415 [Flavobacterium album]